AATCARCSSSSGTRTSIPPSGTRTSRRTSSPPRCSGSNTDDTVGSQWGRGFERRNHSSGCTMATACCCFNGAVASQRRKRLGLRAGEPNVNAGFNGAVASQRRKQCHRYQSAVPHCKLQWSRRLSATETPLHVPAEALDRRPSMEPSPLSDGNKEVGGP